MSELKRHHINEVMDMYNLTRGEMGYSFVYYADEADNVIAEKDAEIARLKNRIAPKQSDKTLQERLNEVCKKHGVSTLQDLDWAFCESEKRRTIDCIEAANIIRHHKYKRCLAMARICEDETEINHNSAYEASEYLPSKEDYFRRKAEHYERWHKRWLELAEIYKEA